MKLFEDCTCGHDEDDHGKSASGVYMICLVKGCACEDFTVRHEEEKE